MSAVTKERIANMRFAIQRAEPNVATMLEIADILDRQGEATVARVLRANAKSIEFNLQEMSTLLATAEAQS